MSQHSLESYFRRSSTSSLNEYPGGEEVFRPRGDKIAIIKTDKGKGSFTKFAYGVRLAAGDATHNARELHNRFREGVSRDSCRLAR